MDNKTKETSIASSAALTLKAVNLNLDTRSHFIAFTSAGCSFCKSAGLRSEARINIATQTHSIIATLDILDAPFLTPGDIGLSESAWKKLGAKEGERVTVTLADPLTSFSHVRAKLHGNPFTNKGLQEIMQDILEGRYSDVQLSSFITACVDLNVDETISLTKAMCKTGRQLTWSTHPIVDKHCVGGLPGNRTTMIVVPIIAAFGLTIPKTSSRAITSPAGTADTMETLAPVTLTVKEMQHVVEKEGGCIVWGGSVDLSPVDDLLVKVERALDLDSRNQLVASVLSKNVAVGATHILIDMPVGPTAKVRFQNEADILASLFLEVGNAIGLSVRLIQTDGTQPIGRGIGPVLEARDVLSILRCEENAPQDLKNKALLLAGSILEAWGGVAVGGGISTAEAYLKDGRAYKKFEAICEAQGGMRELVFAPYKHVITAHQKGVVSSIDSRLLARIAKLAGAPDAAASGIDMHVSLRSSIEKGQPLFTIYAESLGELHYALHYFLAHPDVVMIQEK